MRPADNSRPTVMLSDEEPALSEAEGTPTKPALPNRVKAFSRERCQAPVWDGHSCPPLLTFSVTLCLCGEWF